MELHHLPHDCIREIISYLLSPYYIFNMRNRVWFLYLMKNYALKYRRVYTTWHYHNYGSEWDNYVMGESVLFSASLEVRCGRMLLIMYKTVFITSYHDSISMTRCEYIIGHRTSMIMPHKMLESQDHWGALRRLHDDVSNQKIKVASGLLTHTSAVYDAYEAYHTENVHKVTAATGVLFGDAIRSPLQDHPPQPIVLPSSVGFQIPSHCHQHFFDTMFEQW